MGPAAPDSAALVASFDDASPDWVQAKRGSGKFVLAVAFSQLKRLRRLITP